MPFGLDIKSLVVGFLIAYFVVPWVLAMLNRPKSTATA
jgi:antibiotic biosynthesis monooxygenase (ABM) superfamily enzyme